MPQDHTLLHQYTAHTAVAGTACDSPGRVALDQLIRRHLDLVYSSALRQVRDPHLAEDITQAVFLILAQRAKSIRDGIAVGGWLLAVTRTTAVDAMRKRTQDQRHELALAKPERTPDDSAQAADWNQLSPVLDAALTRLSPSDRDALILRFFENLPLTQVGAALGISQDTAAKRVQRALTRLRTILQSRGILTPTAALTASLSTNAIHAAPAHLLTATLAITTAGTASTSVTALVQNTLRAMAQATAKLVAATALAFVLLTALSFVTLSYAFGPTQPATSVVAQLPFVAPAAPFTAADPGALSVEDTFMPPPLLPPANGLNWMRLSGSSVYVSSMTADASGNVYAVGRTLDSTGAAHGIVRAKLNGQAEWTTVFDVLGSHFVCAAVNAAGDLYVGDNGFITYKRPAGQLNFLPIDNPPVGIGGPRSLTIDARANVYIVGGVDGHWIIRKQALGIGDFTTVDDFIADNSIPLVDQRANPSYGLANLPFGVNVIAGGPAAGLYVVGHANLPAGTNATGAPLYRYHWLVRKSADNGKTWSTVDDFTREPSPSREDNTAWAVCAGRAGDVYVIGTSGETTNPTSCHWITRRSPTGNFNTWSTVDDVESASARWAGADLAGNVYAVGCVIDDPATMSAHAVIRCNASGPWQNVDEYAVAASRTAYEAFTVDSHGRIYAGGTVVGSAAGWLVCSAMPGVPPIPTPTSPSIQTKGALSGR